MAPLFRYDPEVTDILADVVSPTALEQLLRRDHELEDYLTHLPVGGSFSVAEALFQVSALNGGGFPAVPDSSSINAEFTFVTGDSSLATPSTNGITFSVAGFFLVSLDIYWDLNGTGSRTNYVSLDGTVFGFPRSGDRVPGLATSALPTDEPYQVAGGQCFGSAGAGDLCTVVLGQNSGGPLNLVSPFGVLKIAKLG